MATRRLTREVLLRAALPVASLALLAVTAWGLGVTGRAALLRLTSWIFLAQVVLPPFPLIPRREVRGWERTMLGLGAIGTVIALFGLWSGATLVTVAVGVAALFVMDSYASLRALYSSDSIYLRSQLLNAAGRWGAVAVVAVLLQVSEPVERERALLVAYGAFWLAVPGSWWCLLRLPYRRRIAKPMRQLLRLPRTNATASSSSLSGSAVTLIGANSPFGDSLDIVFRLSGIGNVLVAAWSRVNARSGAQAALRGAARGLLYVAAAGILSALLALMGVPGAFWLLAGFILVSLPALNGAWGLLNLVGRHRPRIWFVGVLALMVLPGSSWLAIVALSAGTLFLAHGIFATERG